MGVRLDSVRRGGPLRTRGSGPRGGPRSAPSACPSLMRQRRIVEIAQPRRRAADAETRCGGGLDRGGPVAAPGRAGDVLARGGVQHRPRGPRPGRGCRAVPVTSPRMPGGVLGGRFAAPDTILTGTPGPLPAPQVRRGNRRPLAERRGEQRAAGQRRGAGDGPEAEVAGEVAGSRPIAAAPQAGHRDVAFAAAAAACLASPPRRLVRQCAMTMPLALRGWQADRDCVRFGLATARRCVATCWPLMVATTVGGGLVVMASATVIVFRDPGDAGDPADPRAERAPPGDLRGAEPSLLDGGRSLAQQVGSGPRGAHDRDDFVREPGAAARGSRARTAADHAAVKRTCRERAASGSGVGPPGSSRLTTTTSGR